MTYDHLPEPMAKVCEALEQARDDTCEQVKYLRYRGYDGAASEAVKRLARIDEALAAARAYRPAPDVREALEWLVAVIDKAGVSNLANGVQLGQVAWLVKANDALSFARAALTGKTEAE